MTTKKCDDDKILNPVSNRCVKRSGTIGKKIIKEMSLHKICKKDEILNPISNRCVKRSGKIGKSVI